MRINRHPSQGPSFEEVEFKLRVDNEVKRLQTLAASYNMRRALRDLDDARAARKKALLLTWLGAVSGVVGLLIWFIATCIAVYSAWSDWDAGAQCALMFIIGTPFICGGVIYVINEHDLSKDLRGVTIAERAKDDVEFAEANPIKSQLT